ncbi:MAG: hypothetical protein KGI29_01280 [Pseudomonadota bacterium]|nr:hypothetical protein [Pseudomonadota bacterium]MDE3037394.1 hypothetical protein [Pseudomonadota bacterium]
MSDTITTYAGGVETVTVIDAQPDPREPGHWLLKSRDGKPMRGKLSLREHAYNIVLPPDSYIIIDADETELFKDSRSDDCVVFALSSDNPAEFYVEQYITGAKGQSPYTAVILRHRQQFTMISAVLYPRDLTELPTPIFLTPGGKIVAATWKEKGEAANAANVKAEYAHGQHDLERILRAVHQQDRKPVIDPNAPKKEWF